MGQIKISHANLTEESVIAKTFCLKLKKLCCDCCETSLSLLSRFLLPFFNCQLEIINDAYKQCGEQNI